MEHLASSPGPPLARFRPQNQQAESIKMTNLSAFCCLIVILTVDSAPQEEAINQLLSSRKKLFVSELLNAIEVNQQGMISTQPWPFYSLPSYGSSLHGKQKTSQQREFSNDAFLKASDFLHMKKAKLSSHNDAESQEVHLLSKLLGQILNAQDELRPRIKSMKNPYTSREYGLATTKESEASKGKMASTADKTITGQIRNWQQCWW